MLYKDIVGRRVRIIRKDCPYYLRRGFIESVDGEYFYVRPTYYKHVIELYRCEIEVEGIDEFNR